MAVHTVLLKEAAAVREYHFQEGFVLGLQQWLGRR